MTNTNELTAKLKAAAVKASGSDWIKESGEGWDAICSSDDQANGGFIIAHFEGPDSAANREFVQAANPANILALTEALEAALRANAAQDDHINQQQDRIDQLEKGHNEAAKHIHSWRRLAKQNIAEREKDIAALTDARQRIASLEARTLTVKLPDYVDGHTLGYGEVNHMIDLCADAIEKACHRDGIKLLIEGE